MSIKARINPTKLYYGILGAHGLFFYIIATINIVYQIQLADLNPLQLILVGTALEVGVFLFEVPTGVVADAVSRRRSVIIGYMLIGFGFIFEGLFPLFTTILLANVIWGVGYTFISGAREAWIADESRADNPGKIFLRGEQIQQLLALIGMAISVILASLTQVNVPIIVGGALFMLMGLILCFIMPEDHFKPTPKGSRSTWKQMKDTLGEGIKLVKVTPFLVTLLIIAGIFGIASEGFDRLWQKHLLDEISLPSLFGLDPILWFGVLYALSMILSAIGTEIARRRIETQQHLGMMWALFWMNALISLGIIAYGLSQSFVFAIAAYWIIMPLRHVVEPLFTAWINQRVVSNVRATIFSLNSQAIALGQVLAAPIVWLDWIIHICSDGNLGLWSTLGSIASSFATSQTTIARLICLIDFKTDKKILL